MNYTRNGSSATRARIQSGNKTLRFTVPIPPSTGAGNATPDRQAARAEERGCKRDVSGSVIQQKRRADEVYGPWRCGGGRGRRAAGRSGRPRAPWTRSSAASSPPPFALATPTPLLCSGSGICCRFCSGRLLELRRLARSDDGGFTAAAGTRDLARCLGFASAFFVCCLRSLLLLPEARRWLWEWPTSTNCFVRGFGLCCPAQSIYIIIYTNVSKKICIQILVKSLIKFFNYEKYL